MNFTNTILSQLKKHYRLDRVFLNYSTPWEFVVAVTLSAQCTDIRVNKVTKKLFQKYKTINDYARAIQKEFEQLIKPAGLYHSKAKNIVSSANIVLKKFDGKVPNTLKKLQLLKGVGRKSANVILSEIYNKNEGIAVDTHVKRLSLRLGLTKSKNPKIIEKDLMKKFSKKDWKIISHLLIIHGRKICSARKPNCKNCFLNKICPSAFKVLGNNKSET